MSEHILLPTGKPHISYSELTSWAQCPYKHNLLHIKKVVPSQISPAMAFGTAVHKGCEHFLKTRELDFNLALSHVVKDYEENRNKPEYLRYKEKDMEKMLETASSILLDVPTFMESTFPGWEYKEAEFNLYEELDRHPGNFFKGFIDGVITVPGKRAGSSLVWVIDWKTCMFGWKREKKQDAMVRNQLVLYKSFWSKRTGTPMKDVRAGFVLLKKTASPGNHCELFSVSVGDTTSERALKLVDNMVHSLKRGVTLKNRSSCDICEFKQTVHCP